MVCTYNDKDIRTAVGLQEAKAKDINEIFGDEKKEKIFYYYQNDCPMAGEEAEDGSWTKGVEDFVPRSQYDNNETHHMQVVEDIKKNFLTLSRGHKFHAIFATSSIPEAINYYREFKRQAPHIKTVVLVDPSDNNDNTNYDKMLGLAEIIDDYNKRYGQAYDISTYGEMKKDISKFVTVI
jgi:type I restriction enzyme R subunit